MTIWNIDSSEPRLANDVATQKETVEFRLAKLRQPERFSARSMFGEYALYGNRPAEIHDPLHKEVSRFIAAAIFLEQFLQLE